MIAQPISLESCYTSLDDEASSTSSTSDVESGLLTRTRSSGERALDAPNGDFCTRDCRGKSVIAGGTLLAISGVITLYSGNEKNSSTTMSLGMVLIIFGLALAFKGLYCLNPTQQE